MITESRIPVFMLFIIFAFTILSSGVYASPTDPVLFFSDLTSGPKTGNGDTSLGQIANTNGAIVTIWGKNLGSSQGSSTVTVGGIISPYVYYWGNAIPPHSPANLYKSHGMQMIVFQIPSTAADGAGTISVTVNGVTSNTLPFTIRTGNIYFIDNKVAGPGSGTYTDPWSSPTSFINKIDSTKTGYVKGAIAYFRAGTYNGQYAGTGQSANFYLGSNYNGSAGNENAFIAYPNELVTIDATSNTGSNMTFNFKTNWDNGKYFIISKFQNYANYSSIQVGSGWRVVGNAIHGHLTPQTVGGAGVITGNGSDYQIYGNEISGANAQDPYYHVFYPGDSNSVDFGWNYIYNNNFAGPIGLFGTWLDARHVYLGYFHDNLIDTSQTPARVFGSANSGACINYFYNNIIVGITSYGTTIDINYCSISSYVYIYSNTFYNNGGVNGSVFHVSTSSNASVITHAFIKNNAVYANSQTLSYLNRRGGTTNLDLNLNSNSWYGIGNFSTHSDTGGAVDPNIINNQDPLFQDPTNLDFHLRSSSPDIDKGTSTLLDINGAQLPGTSKDFDAVPRPQPPLGAYDIGAYEYVQFTPPTLAISSVSAASTYNSATVTWATNLPSNSQVEYGLDIAYGQSTPLDTTMVVSHSAILSGLSSSTAYHYRAKSTDATGNQVASADYTFITQLTPDTTSPTVSLGSPTDGTTLTWGSTATFTYTALDDRSSAGSCSLIINSAVDQTTSVLLTTSPQQLSFSKSNLANGDYTWSISCTDAANNVGTSQTWLLHVQIVPDTTPPTVTLLIPTDGSTQTWSSSSTTTFSYSVSDDRSGSGSCSLFIDGAVDQSAAVSLATTAQTLSFSKSSLPNGDHTWSVSCTDAANNVGTPATPYTLHVTLPTGGTVYYIATTGSDSNDGSLAHPWLTLQHAVASVSPGDTIKIEPGTYPYGGYYAGQPYAGNVRITTPNITITAADPTTKPTLDFRFDSNNWLALSITANATGVTISYLNLTDSTTVQTYVRCGNQCSYTYQILVSTGATGFTADHDEISNAHIAISLHEGRNATISNNLIYGLGIAPVNSSNSLKAGAGVNLGWYIKSGIPDFVPASSWNEKTLIINNDISDSGNDDIQLEAGENVNQSVADAYAVQYVEIAYNYLHYAWEGGIDLKRAQYLRFHHNKFIGNGMGIVSHSATAKANDLEVYDNIFAYNGEPTTEGGGGITMGTNPPPYNSSYNGQTGNVRWQIYNNLFYKNYEQASKGIQVTLNGDNNSFYHNTLYNNNDTGANIAALSRGMGNISIIDNVFYSDPALGNLTYGNIARGNVGPGSVVDHNYFWSANPRYGVIGTNSITVADPMLNNPGGDDFTLKAGSPLIDAGINVGIATDFAGVSRPQGAGYDIGAYEYYTGSTQTCSDGTVYGSCSATKPKYCSNGNLIDACSSHSCGCPTGQTCDLVSQACVDTTPPTVTIQAPANTTYSANKINLNYIASDNVAVDTCKYSLNDNANVTLTNCRNTTFTGSGGWNKLYVFVNDSSGNDASASVSFTITTDTTPPTVTLLIPTDGSTQTWSSSSTTAFSYSVSDASAIQSCSLTINGAVDQTNTAITKDISQEFSKTLSNGDYTWGINCIDSANNVGTSTTRLLHITLPPPPPPSTGGGGSGGGGGGGGSSGGWAPPPIESGTKKPDSMYIEMEHGVIHDIIYTYMQMQPNIVHEIDIAQPDFGMGQISMAVVNSTDDVKITIFREDQKPANITQDVPGMVYKYLQITHENLANSNIKSAKVRFNVTKSWLAANGYGLNDITLQRYNNGWTKISVARTTESSSEVEYEAEIPGLSVFAIAAEKSALPAVCGNNAVEGTEQCDGTDLGGQTCVSRGFVAGTLGCKDCMFDTSTCTAPAKPQALISTTPQKPIEIPLWFYVLMTVLAIIGVGGYIYYHKHHFRL